MLIGFSSMHRAQFRFPFLLAGIFLTMANLIEICRFSFSRFQTCLDNFASCLYFSLHRDSNDFCILSHVCLSHGWCYFSLSSIYRQWGSSRIVVSCRVFRRLNYFFRSLACWSVFSFGMILLPLSKKDFMLLVQLIRMICLLKILLSFWLGGKCLSGSRRKLYGGLNQITSPCLFRLVDALQ